MERGNGRTVRLYLIPAFVWLGMAVMVLQGCSMIPGFKPEAEMRSSAGLKNMQSFESPPAEWPKEEWWRAYGDPQLDRLVEEALEDSPSLSVARSRLRKAGSMARMAGAVLLPQMNLNASVTEQRQSYNYLIPAEVTPHGWNDYGITTIDFNWELDFWGKNRSALSAAITEVEAMHAELAHTRLLLSTAVAAAYAELAHSYKSRDTAKSAMDVRAKTAELFRSRYRHGLETLGSVRQVESLLAGAEAAVVALDERIALQKNAIAALTGAVPDRALSIERPKIDLSVPRGLPRELALDLLGRRPDIVAARMRAEAAARRIDQRKAEFYPNINLMAFFGVQSLGLNMLLKSSSIIGSVGPAVSLPILNTRRLQRQLEGAFAEYDQAVAVYNSTLVNALREVADAAASRKHLGGQLKAHADAYERANEAHRIATLRYRGGLSDYLDVLSAEDAMLGAQYALTDIQSRALTLDVALVRSLGGGYQGKKSAEAE